MISHLKKKKLKNKGVLITFEGIEGSGKSTHINRLAQFLKKIHLNVIITKEPGGTEIGQHIRKVFLHPKNKKITSLTELFLMLADRNQHVDEYILPYLNQNFIVLSDRYIDSTVAYQTIDKKINIKLINQLNRIVIKNAIPALTFLMDSNIKQSLNKVKKLSKEYKGGDRIENKNLNYHLKVQEQYYLLQKKYPKRVIRINTQSSINKTQQQIRTITLNYLKKKKII